MENNLVKSIEYKGYTINVVNDKLPESPDTFENEDCFIIYDHRDFSVERKGFDGQEIFNHLCQGKKLYKHIFNKYWIIPLYAYIHSGIYLSLGNNSYPFTCQFDTSMKGFVLVKRQKGWSYTFKQALKIAKSLVTEWNDYLSGNVYGYEILNSNNEITISCYGYYGEKSIDEIIIPECKNDIDISIELDNLIDGKQ